jgi:hypothetical protein
MSTEEQVKRLARRIEEFARCVESPPEGAFLEKIGDWAPRDVLAHLIGWNRLTIAGCQQIARGETPFYFVDPGDDFSKVNAVLVRKYGATDQGRLLSQLEASVQELQQFVASLGPTEWETYYGVRYRGGVVTIRNTVDVLIYEYTVHRQRIEEWAK